jgi:ribosome assembly protein 1
VEKIVKTLNLKILPRDLRAKDTRNLLTAIFSQWLPLSTAVLLTVIEKLPSPIQAQTERTNLILENQPQQDLIPKDIELAMKACDSGPDAPVVAYVSKMVAVPEKELPRSKAQTLTAEEMRARAAEARRARLEVAKVESVTQALGEATISDSVEKNEVEPEQEVEKEVLIGVARLYSGTVRVGQELHIYGPKYSPEHPDEHHEVVTITNLYLIMGRELISLDSVPAGNVFGINGLEGKILKNGTICSVSPGINLAGIQLGSAPIVRVALEPVWPADLPKLVEGLRLLNQADSCVQVLVQDSGEHVILTAGELHLERCLNDLRERFAKIEISASKPIVPFRETIVKAPDMVALKDTSVRRGTANVTTPNGDVSVRIRTRPLPKAVTDYLLKHGESMKHFLLDRKSRVEEDLTTERITLEKTLTLSEFKKGLEEVLEAEGGEWRSIIDKYYHILVPS